MEVEVGVVLLEDVLLEALVVIFVADEEEVMLDAFVVEAGFYWENKYVNIFVKNKDKYTNKKIYHEIGKCHSKRVSNLSLLCKISEILLCNISEIFIFM